MCLCIWRLIIVDSPYFYSGSACVQAITGMIWPDSDLDIYCSADSAPYVRSWLVGLDLQQAFSGCSSVSDINTIQSLSQCNVNGSSSFFDVLW